MKTPDFIKTTDTIKRLQVTCVARGELACFQITATQVWIAKCLGALSREKVKPQPAPVSFRNALGLSEKRDEQKQNKIRIYLRLELEVARKIFRPDLADSPFELKRGMQCMIEFFDEHD